jgi:hypothetical protein
MLKKLEGKINLLRAAHAALVHRCVRRGRCQRRHILALTPRRPLSKRLNAEGKDRDPGDATMRRRSRGQRPWRHTPVDVSLENAGTPFRKRSRRRR